MKRLVDAGMRLALPVAFQGMKAWWRLTGRPAQGACVLILHENRLLVAHLSYRRALALPGGGLGRNEQPQAGAVRELSEEIGLTVRPNVLQPLGTCTLLEDHRMVTTHLFLWRVDTPPPLAPDRREIVRVEFLTLAELETRPLTPVLAYCCAGWRAGTLFNGQAHHVET